MSAGGVTVLYHTLNRERVIVNELPGIIITGVILTDYYLIYYEFYDRYYRYREKSSKSNVRTRALSVLLPAAAVTRGEFPSGRGQIVRDKKN